jgi:hypothetical protein
MINYKITFLAQISPNARESESNPSNRFRSTVPPAFRIRSISSGSLGKWGLVINLIFPLWYNNALPSPILAVTSSNFRDLWVNK